MSRSSTEINASSDLAFGTCLEFGNYYSNRFAYIITWFFSFVSAENETFLIQNGNYLLFNNSLSILSHVLLLTSSMVFSLIKCFTIALLSNASREHKTGKLKFHLTQYNKILDAPLPGEF